MPVFPNHLDEAHDIVVECLQVLRRDPPFRVILTAYLVHLVTTREVGAHGKSRDITDASISRIPPAGDLDRVALVRDGIEDRLPRQPRRSAAETALFEQLQLLRPHGPIHHDDFIRPAHPLRPGIESGMPNTY